MDPREKAQDVEDKGLIENIRELDPAIIAIDKNIVLILGLFLGVPMVLLTFYKLKGSPSNSEKQLTEPLLEIKEEDSII